MWQGHLIRRAPSKTSPHDPLAPRQVYTPTADGFERFLRTCVGLSRGEGPAPRARGPRTPPRAT